MKRVLRFWKVFIFDLVGIALMILAILTGWLPGPGGIPLFILGLSVLAIHHDWAQKYIDQLKDYVDSLGDKIFVEDKDVQLAYDIICPVMVAGGIYLLWLHNATWQITLGIILLFTGVTVLIGNRKRWQRFIAKFKRKT
ncbi:hypothetical protein H0X10_02220 [Candidatus Saccharibacteria bacterium]|nr:hypothetical protein [Candidatus Saccharibacteria bacterium]